MPKYANEDEVVYDASQAKTPEERKELMKHNERAKMLHAERREQERIEAPSLYERLKNGVKRILGRVQQKQIEKSKGNSR